MARRKKNTNIKGPVSTIIILTAVMAILSFILSIFGFQGNKTYIGNGSLETSLVVVKNIISIDGIKYIIGNVVTNFISFKPLAVMIISLTGIGILEKSGLMYAIFNKFKNVKFEIIIFFTILAGVISSFIGEYSYMLLIPFVAIMYKYLNRNPIFGILTVFIGITLGYGANLIFTYDDYQLGKLTEAAANLEVDPDFKYNLFSNIYIMIFTTLLLTFVATIDIKKYLFPKYPKKIVNEEEDNNVTKKGLLLTNLIFVGLILVVVYMVLDIKLPGAGILLDSNASDYMSKLFGSNSPFREGLMFIITSIMMILGFIYGKISKNIKNSHEYSLGLSKNFENLGLMFVLMFFTSIMVSILDYTNIGVVISSNLVDFISSISLSGTLLILIFMFVVIIMSILIPDTYTKWQLLSPTVIPLFMRANITPSFVQFTFRIADGIGKSITPFFIYLIIMIAFLEKYNVDEKKKISIAGTMKAIMPVILILSLTLILTVVLWHIIGIPIGVGTGVTI